MTPDQDPTQRLFSEDGPQIESTVKCSNNGKYLIHRTVITHIKPTAYYEAILRNNRERQQEEHQ